MMRFFSWGRKDTWDGFCYDSTAGVTLSFEGFASTTRTKK